MQAFEHITVNAKDGAVIPVVTYNLDKAEKKGIIIVCHGFGEHSGGYFEHAERLWQGGYSSVILDQRGHGKPPEGARKWHGLIPDYQCFIDDIVSVTDEIKRITPNTPIAIYGHSMGGNIVANTLLRLPPAQARQYFCAALESPWFELYKPISKFNLFLIKTMNVIYPNFIHRRDLEHNILSSDTEKRAGYAKDPYYHGKISVRMLSGVLEGCKYALDNAARLPVKTYVAYADNDLVVCNKAILEFAAAAAKKVTLKEYASNHAIYNDVSREAYCRDLIAFFNLNI